MLLVILLSLFLSSASAYMMSHMMLPSHMVHPTFHIVPGRVYPPLPMRVLGAPTMGLGHLSHLEAVAEMEKMLSVPYYHNVAPRAPTRGYAPARWFESKDGTHAVLRVEGLRKMTPTASLEPDGTLTIKGEKKVESFLVTKEMSVDLPFQVSDPTAVRLSLGRNGVLTVKVPLEARAAAPEATELEVEVLEDEGDEPMTVGIQPAVSQDEAPAAEGAAASTATEADDAAALEATLDEKFGFVVVEPNGEVKEDVDAKTHNEEASPEPEVTA